MDPEWPITPQVFIETKKRKNSNYCSLVLPAHSQFSLMKPNFQVALALLCKIHLSRSRSYGDNPFTPSLTSSFSLLLASYGGGQGPLVRHPHPVEKSRSTAKPHYASRKSASCSEHGTCFLACIALDPLFPVFVLIIRLSRFLSRR